jgi:hypothetical protein
MISGAKLGNKTLITKLKPPYFTPPPKKVCQGGKNQANNEQFSCQKDQHLF